MVWELMLDAYTDYCKQSILVDGQVKLDSQSFYCLQTGTIATLRELLKVNLNTNK